MLYRFPSLNILFAVVLCFFLSLVTLAQPGNSDKHITAQRSIAGADRTAMTNWPSRDGGKKSGVFGPVIIYYRKPALVTAADRETKHRDSEMSPLESRTSGQRPAIPAQSRNAGATLRTITKTAVTLQPITIRYRSYGRSENESPLTANTVIRQPVREKRLLDLRAAPAKPTSIVKAEANNKAPAAISAATGALTPAPKLQINPASADLSGGPSDRSVLVEKKGSPAATDTEAKSTLTGRSSGEIVVEQPQTTVESSATEETGGKEVRPVVALPNQQQQAEPLAEKSENTPTAESFAPPAAPSISAAALEAAAAPDMGSAERTAKTSNDAVDLNNTAIGLTRESRYEEAAQALERAIAAEPGQFKFHRNLSVVYEQMNRMDEALAAARKSVDLAPREAIGFIQLCGLELMTGRNAEAIGCYEKLAQLGPLDGDAQTFYGIALLRSGENQKAMSILENAAAHPPANIGTLNALGLVYFNLKRYSDAAQCFKQAVELDPRRGELRFNLAIAQMANRNKEGGLSQYRILKEEDPKLANELYEILFQDSVVHVDVLKEH